MMTRHARRAIAADPAPKPPRERTRATRCSGSPRFRRRRVRADLGDDDSGMLAAIGRVKGKTVVAFCSDPTVMGGAMGDEGCKVVVAAYQRALTDRCRSSGCGTPVAPASRRACCRCTPSG